MTLIRARTASMALVPILALPAHAKDEACFESWSEAAPIVQSEGLVSTHDLYQQLRDRHSGEVIRITLCREGQRFVYRVVLRQDSGRLVNHSLDARRPFDR